MSVVDDPDPARGRHPRRPSRTVLAAVALGVVAAVGVLLVWSPLGTSRVPSPQAADAADAGRAAPATPTTAAVTVTFYAAADNDPPGSTEIAFPGRRPAAGGAGTWQDPLTFATDPRFLPPGTRIYDPRLQKYFVMEDSCASCISDFSAGRTPHIDLWTGPATDGSVLDCENALTPDGPVPVEIGPPPDRPVDPVALYDQATGTCHLP